MSTPNVATVHFSIFGLKGICGAGPSKRGVFFFTADLADLTCERCKTLVQNESATGAELWAMDAEEQRRRALDNKSVFGTLPSLPHLQRLYVIAVQKREAAVQRCREKLEYEQEQLTKLVERAHGIGVPRGV